MLREITRTVAFLALALLAAVALVFALAQTDRGKNTLARFAANALSKDPATEVQVGRLSGWIPFNFQLHSLSISDERGPWLEVEGISVRWSPFALLGGRLSIHEVTARSVDLLRMPQDGDEAHAKTPDPPDWPEALLRVELERLEVERILFGDALLGMPLLFSLKARVGETSPHGEKQTLIRMEEINREGTSLALEATFHAQERTVEGRYTLLFKHLESLQPILKAGLKGRMRAEGHFSGPFLRPQSSVRIEMEYAGLNGVKASRLDADFRVELLEDLGSFMPRSRLTGSGALEGLVVEGFEKFSEKSILWELSAQGLEEDGIHVSRFMLTSGQNSLQLTGLIDPSGPKGELEIAFESGGLGDLFQLIGLDVPWIGPTLLNATVEGDAQGHSLKTQFQAKSTFLGEHLQGFSLPPQKEVSYGATFLIDQAKILTVPRFWLETGGASLKGQGSFDFHRDFVVSSWDALLPNPAAFISIPHLSPQGPLKWAGTMEGPLSLLRVSTQAEATNVEVRGVLLDKVAIFLRAVNKPSVKQGDVSLELFQGDKWIRARSEFVLDAKVLHLSGTSIAGFESGLHGKATFDLEGPEVQGEFRWNVSDLSLILSLLGHEIRGSAKGEAEFRLGGENQFMALSFEASSLASPFGAAQGLLLESRMEGSMEPMKGSLRLEIKDARILDLALSSLVFKADGGIAQAAFQLEAMGHYGEDFDSKTSGVFALSQVAQRVTLNRFRGRYGPPSAALPLTLVEPTVILKEEGVLRMENASFILGTGSLKGSGAYASNEVGFDLSFEDFPLDFLKLAGAPGLRGKVSGALFLEGHPAQPKARFELLAVNLGYDDVHFPDLPSPSLDLRGSFANQSLKADLAFRGLTPDPLKASAEFPLAFSLAPFLFSLDPRASMEANLHGEAPLSHLASLLHLDDQVLRGRVETDLRVAGPMAKPRVKGSLRVIDGGYENFRTGTMLRGANLILAAENGRLMIQEAGASDGGKGAVALDGWFELSPEKDFPFQVNIGLRDATLLRHDTITATTGGNLVFAGNRKGALLSGDLTIDPLELRMPRRLPPEIADLAVIEIHGEKIETPVVVAAKKPAQDPFLELRVTINIPSRAYLTGRGLDSEWRGKLEIQGSSRDAALTGDLSIVRGHFNFLGRRFNLTRGVVSFLGDAPPSPILNLTAEASTREITAFLHLSGKVDSPELALTSQPPLPNDEILSRLLFGRSVTQITPLQALQLAHALDVLAGRRGFDLIDHTRRTLGLDLLEIKDLGVELDEAALRLGKYLAENVYIEVEQGLGPESGRASIQWEVTPNITIQTEVGINAEAGAGIRWKWDY